MVQTFAAAVWNDLPEGQLYDVSLTMQSLVVSAAGESAERIQLGEFPARIQSEA